MNKIQDGFVAFVDSYKPVTITSDRRHYGHISFVGDEIIIRAGKGSGVELLHSDDDGLRFKLVDGASLEPAEVDDAVTEPPGT